MEVVASLSQGRTASAQCGLFTHKSVPVIFEPHCIVRKSSIIETSVFFVAPQPSSVLGRLNVQVSRLHTIRHALLQHTNTLGRGPLKE